MAEHQWVDYVKGRIKVTGCSCCGQIKLPTNQDKQCEQVTQGSNILLKNGYKIRSFQQHDSLLTEAV